MTATPPHALRIGLTGPIGCGKSTVAGWLEEVGAFVIDADQIAREVVEAGEPALEAVLARFGEDLRRDDGTLDRAALGRIVFSDPAALHDLEAITHPAVRGRIYEALTANVADEVDVEVIEAIKLVEGGLAEWCDEVWLVTCDPTIQRERLIGRGATPETADQRMAAQAGVVERVGPVATRVIDTSGDEAAVRNVVLAAFEAAMADR